MEQTTTDKLTVALCDVAKRNGHRALYVWKAAYSLGLPVALDANHAVVIRPDFKLWWSPEGLWCASHAYGSAGQIKTVTGARQCAELMVEAALALKFKSGKRLLSGGRIQ